MWIIYIVVAVCGFVGALILMPLALRIVRPLVSPYQKADIERRFLASFVDLWLMVACYTVLARYDVLLAVTMSPLYLVVRDGFFGGQSFGKMMVGLVTIELETGRPIRLVGSLRRNFFFAIPGAQIVAVLFEAREARSNEQGMRLGDRLARTQVVHGKEAIDLLKAVTEAVRLIVAKLRDVSPRRAEHTAERTRRSETYARRRLYRRHVHIRGDISCALRDPRHSGTSPKNRNESRPTKSVASR